MNGSPEILNALSKAFNHLEQFDVLMRRGPGDYYIAKLLEYSEALLTRFSPFKIGDRTAIIEPPDCSGAWASHERSLRVGSVGTIRDVDYGKESFIYLWEPDVGYWRDSEGCWRESSSPVCFWVSEKHIAPSEDD